MNINFHSLANAYIFEAGTNKMNDTGNDFGFVGKMSPSQTFTSLFYARNTIVMLARLFAGTKPKQQ